jgi:hypothetical protein
MVDLVSVIVLHIMVRCTKYKLKVKTSKDGVCMYEISFVKTQENRKKNKTHV